MNWKLYLLLHKQKIKSFANIARSIADFAFTRSKLSLVAGGLLGVEELLNLGSQDSLSVFNHARGWDDVFNYHPLNDLFLSVIEKLPGKDLPFNYDPGKYYHLNGLEFVVIYNRYGEDRARILTKPKNKAKVKQFLVDEKLKELNSNFLSLCEPNHEEPTLLLSPLEIETYTSERAAECIVQIQKAFDHQLNRSLLFIGLPGTGKSYCAQTIAHHFNFRTLKFRPLNYFALPHLLEFIDLFKIEAIIMDDFDQIETDERSLELLEILNKKLKLVIGTANVIGKFDPAIIRPGRFSELIQIESLDQETIKKVLGSLYKTYGTKTETWPIAYVNELKIQSKLNPDKIEERYTELNQRIIDLKESYRNMEKEE